MTSRQSVMISSTARDLPDHREQVRIACERAGFAPHDMMEHLTALDADPIAASIAMVDRADIYLGIFAYRYGAVPDGHDVSITEMEYDRAVKLNKPRLIFFAHQDHPFTVRDVETGPGAAKLQALKDKIGKNRVAAFFQSPQDLRAHVMEALVALSKQLDAAEPETASERAITELHRKTILPEPPTPYIAHPYTLLQTRELVGRQTELNLLTDWVTKPESVAKDATVFAIVAIGGMGKSASAWKWFNQIAPNEMKALAGRIWWSFYESDATFENFINRALCYVSGRSEDEVRQLPWPDREALLLQHLQEKTYLFVLDGLERVLIAYNRMDASILADDEYDEQAANYVTGAIGLPASAAQSFVGQHRLRHTTDPRAGAFFQKLSRTKQSRILITTRLYPSALQLPTGHPCPGCSAYFLRGLSDDDALALWRGLTVSGSREELLPIFRSVGNHPMLIQALASEIANYRKAPGDFSVWRSDHPQFEPTSLPLVQSRTHILGFALAGLSGKHRELLHTIVGFRMPAGYEALAALLVGPKKKFESPHLLDLALSELEDRGLIGWDREANRYDAHPIVRGVVWHGTRAKDKHSVLSALAEHFEAIPTPHWRDVDKLEDLTPAIERFHTLVELDQFDDALDLFNDRLASATFYRLSAHRERITWLERLLERVQSTGKTLSGKGAWLSVQSALALSYDITGQPGRALGLLRLSTEEANENRLSLAISYSNLANVLIELGKLADGYLEALVSLAYGRTDQELPHEAIILRELAQQYSIQGRTDSALVSIYRSRRISVAYLPESEGRCCASLSLIHYLSDNLTLARELANRAWTIAHHQRIERDLIIAAHMQGRSALKLNDLDQASERLHHALLRARNSNVVEFELPILVTIAQLELREGHPDAARLRLDEAWDAINCGPYPLVAAEAYNVLAEVERAVGDNAAAAQAAGKAFEAAWCDGPPFAYDHALKAARAHLADLGVPEPVTIPFDERRLASIPDVEINPDDDYWVDPDNLVWD